MFQFVALFYAKQVSKIIHVFLSTDSNLANNLLILNLKKIN